MLQEVNVEEIMKEIREQIKEKGLEDIDLQFEDVVIFNKSSADAYIEEEFLGALDRARPHTIVNAAPQLSGNVISRIIKKIIRRVMAFHLEYIVDEQNEYNIYSYQAISMLPDRFKEEDDRILELEKQLIACQKKIEVLEEQIKKQ